MVIESDKHLLSDRIVGPGFEEMENLSGTFRSFTYKCINMFVYWRSNIHPGSRYSSTIDLFNVNRGWTYTDIMYIKVLVIWTTDMVFWLIFIGFTHTLLLLRTILFLSFFSRTPSCSSSMWCWLNLKKISSVLYTRNFPSLVLASDHYLVLRTWIRKDDVRRDSCQCSLIWLSNYLTTKDY